MTDQHNPDGWTFATLHRHFTALREDDQRAIAAALASQKEATTKADADAIKRADLANETKDAMKDQQATFATIKTVELLFDEMRRRLTNLESVRDISAGKSQGAVSVREMIAWALLVATALAALWGKLST